MRRVDERLVDNGDITLRVEVTGDGPDGPVRARLAGAGVVVAPPGAPPGRARATGSRPWTCAATAAARRHRRSSATRSRELASDVAAVAAALDDGPIVLVGHDWGAPIVWNTAIRHPDRVRAVAGLSVPYTPPIGALAARPVRPALRRPVLLHAPLPRSPDVPEAEFGVDLRAALEAVLLRAVRRRAGRAAGCPTRPATPRSSRSCPTRPTDR